MSDVLAIRMEDHTITTRDKTLLTAKLYRPLEHNNHTVLIAPAMGIPQRFYRHYAKFLAEQGCIVLTFDYRGIAESMQNGTLWGYEAHVWQWASQDLQAMIKWLTRQYPGTELTIVGHSLGGHLVGGASHNSHVASILGASAQSTYWRHWVWWQQPIVFIFWFILLPLLSHAIGYFPSSWFGLGEKLPKHIALDWSKAASNPSGTRGIFRATPHDHYDQFTGYTRFYSFTDDTMMAPRASVDAILGFYPNATRQQRRHVSPQSIGVEKIGHLRFFHPEMQATLWQESFNWLMNPAVASDTILDDDTPALQPTGVPQAG